MPSRIRAENRESDPEPIESGTVVPLDLIVKVKVCFS